MRSRLIRESDVTYRGCRKIYIVFGRIEERTVFQASWFRSTREIKINVEISYTKWRFDKSYRLQDVLEKRTDVND